MLHYQEIKIAFVNLYIAIFILLIFQKCSTPGDKTAENRKQNVVTIYDTLPYQDVEYFSDVFDTVRNYRIYLPENYNRNQAYPVVYYFHGWSGRYKWDAYDLEYDVEYPENGRKEPPFVMEWKQYTRDHDVIIVTWDGYVPIHEGIYEREGIKYGESTPYDCRRAYGNEDENPRMGWDFSLYFRELVKNVDDNYSTIADRDHRAITGLSMGGQTSLYVAGQNKDLVSSVSAFDPADNAPLYGINEYQVVFPVLEMYRSLNGLSVRLTATDGDWLKYNDYELKKILEIADVSHFEFHLADFPDHWAGDIDQQLDFHMKEFSKQHKLPHNWCHISPGFPVFAVWNYQFNINRSVPAFTILKNVTPSHFRIIDRTFIPDGKIVRNEKVTVLTDALYEPETEYEIVSYNLSNQSFAGSKLKSDSEGRLSIGLEGGGNVVGITGENNSNHAILRIVPKGNQEYFYYETGGNYSFNFNLVNVGLKDAGNIRIRAFSNQPYVKFNKNVVSVNNCKALSSLQLHNQFSYHLAEYIDTASVGKIFFEVSVDGMAVDTQNIMFFATPKSIGIRAEDIIILDGRKVDNVPVFIQGPNEIKAESISGGKGNGNGKIDGGENILAYIKLPKGMGEADLNTYHRTYLLNQFDDDYVKVDTLQYFKKINQAGATSIATVLSIDPNTPAGHIFDFWFQVESLYNDNNDPAARIPVYARKYDYRRVKLVIGE